jgi:hypothetical protein
MAAFNFYHNQDIPFSERYRNMPEIQGAENWSKFIENPSLLALNNIRNQDTSTLTCPRIFISHRQADEKYGRRIAYLSAINGFDFWLDVLDPSLKSLTNLQRLSEDQKLLITAGIIEMAIINCSHVLAIISSNTLGTMWVPYEYGRITDIPTTYGRAAAWKHPSLNFYYPEYLLLGNNPKCENEIKNWLTAEKRIWQSKYNVTCGPVIWNGAKPEKLPNS